MAAELQNPTDSAATSPAAMALLANEFRTILLRHTIPVNTELIDSLGNQFSNTCSYTDSDLSCYTEDWMDTKFDLVPTEAINDLCRIAGRMIYSGYSRECVEAYASTRKTFLNETFKILGIEKLSSKTIQRLEWSVLELRISRWIRAAKIAVRFLFAAERRLSQRIFESFGYDTACFMAAIKDFSTTLFDFMEAISSSRRSPEKLFRILDLHQVLCDLLPDIQGIFRSKSEEFIRKQAVELSLSLSEAVRETLLEFEKALLGEPTKIPVSGDVHPLTKYTMNYVSLMGDYKRELEELIVSNPSIHRDSDISKFHRGTLSPFVLHLFSIIATLKFVLEGSLSFLYDVIKRGPRQRLNAFNKKFKKVIQTQVTWVVSDYQYCVELRISIIEKIIPVYTSFLEKYRSGKHPENGIKYSPQDIEKEVNKLFRGF